MCFDVKPVRPEQVGDALELALSVFMAFESPAYGAEAVAEFRDGCIRNREYIEQYVTGKRLMFAAFAGGRMIGMVCERGGAHIAMLFVDGAWHRRGVGTALLREMTVALRKRGYGKITLNAAPCALPFYKHFGFAPTGPEQRQNGFIFTPMAYEPNELWDADTDDFIRGESR